MSEELDLSGEWTGVYSYPGAGSPVPFTASLSEREGWLTGAVEERSTQGPPRRLGATIQGRRAGVSVTWLKTYDVMEHGYDAVQYEGAVSADGAEISGRWAIFENGSGTFLMTRKPGAQAARRRSATTRA